MKVTYLCHSGFAVELERHILVFDYDTGELPIFDQGKQLLVFASHFHPDHYNKKILSLKGLYPNVRYVFSKDIPIPKEERDESMHFMKKRDMAEVAGCRIRTLRSNDEGVAFLVQVPEGADGRKTIYHAGDLNWWYWEEEDDETWNEPMRQAYQKEIAKIEGEEIDYAFFPLDSRQGEESVLGINYFMRHTNTKIVFPMHMWGYDILDKFLEKSVSEPYRERIMKVKEPGQSFYFEEER